MKPLSSGQREFLYRRLVLGRARRLFHPLYEALNAVLVGGHRVEDLFYPSDGGDISQLTIIVKTFERPYAIRRLVRSIRRRYPAVKIIVADDSKKAVPLDEVQVIRLPFDVGIPKGRNRALDEVTTKYVMLLDDDFVFSHRQRLAKLVGYMDAHPQVDIAGGHYLDLPLYIEHEFEKGAVFPTVAQPKLPLGTRIGDGLVVDKVQNYFIARTESVKKVRWNESLKLQEHTEFFTRARGRLVTVYLPEMKILHVRTVFDLNYLRYRWRTAEGDWT
jgi:hypothetical protein